LQNSVRFFRERGYGIISSVFSPAELSAACSELSSAGLRRSRAGARHVLSLASVSEIARRGEMLAIARAVLGPDAARAAAGLPPRDSRLGPVVDQGRGYLCARSRCGIAASTCASRSPRSVDRDEWAAAGDTRHARTWSAHRRRDFAAGRRVRSDCLHRWGRRRRCDAPAVLHASSKSESDEPRRVLHIEFAASRGIGDGLRLALV
jgi:hypothetical protein